MDIRRGRRYSAVGILREGVYEGWKFRDSAYAENISNAAYSILLTQDRDCMTQLSFLAQLEKYNNEPEVRERLARGEYHSEQVPIVIEWLRCKEEARSSAAAARTETREEENLSISRKALNNSVRATRIAICAIVLSIIMATLEIIKWYSKH